MTVRAENGNLSGQFKALISVLVAILLGLSSFLATAAYTDIKSDVYELQKDQREDHDTLVKVQSDVAYIRSTLDQWEATVRGN